MMGFLSITSFVKSVDHYVIEATEVIDVRNFKCFPHIIYWSNIPFCKMGVPDKEVVSFVEQYLSL